MTYGLTWSPIFTSRLETLLILLNKHFIYSVLLLFKQKLCISKSRLQVFNLSFKFFSDFSNMIILSAHTHKKHTSHCASYWMHYASTSKIKIKWYGFIIESLYKSIVMKNPLSPYPLALHIIRMHKILILF